MRAGGPGVSQDAPGLLGRSTTTRRFWWVALVLAFGGCPGKDRPPPAPSSDPGQGATPPPPRLLRVVPGAAVLSPFEPGQPPPEITLRVTSPTGRPFRLVRVRDPSGALRGAVAPEGNAWLIRVVAVEAPRTTEGFLVVETSLPEEPRFALPWVVSDPTTWLIRARQRGSPDPGESPPARP